MDTVFHIHGVWVLVVIIGAVVSMCGNRAIRFVFAKVDAHEENRPDSQKLLKVEEKFHGGRVIGVLERLAVYLSVVLGFSMGIGVVLAIKGLGRYPELRNESNEDGNSRVGELFIIGTFLSILWAVLWAILVRWICVEMMLYHG